MAINKVRRAPQRASYEWQDLESVLVEGKVCHVGIHDERPVVIPMSYALDGKRVLLHGSTKSRLLQKAAAGAPVCIAVTHLDALVLAKSVFNHSMNYRSAVVFGHGQALAGDKKLEALRLLTEHLAPDRWEEARQPNESEMEATLVVAVEIEEFSVKSRHGPPSDKPEDEAWDVWSGLIERREEWVDPRTTP